MKKFLTISILSAFLIAASVAIAAVPDFTMYGFPNVVASIIIQPDQNAVLTLGNASINIPEGAFGNVPVKFELLTATPTSWQKYVPSNQKVLYAFAFKVTDLTTGALIGKFSKPVIFYFSSSQITSQAQYLDTTTSFVVSKNPIPPKIEFNGQIGTLSHPIAGAPVGWLVTVPE
ncbi:hypothetical protein [Athalassotoga saccharophila]|uniref:hypothetical protein n=1 Tax=Athalassotoga saccharophila TaxID=1441386 RepID=UPI00137A3911|nr:hypothetical protein [Athalassotoga saccharophila]BBJ27439.1 hypothetical protein ATHSA_0308 [Athalassotoga saccharophila]